VTRNPKKRISLGYRFFIRIIVRLKQKSPVRFRRLSLPKRLRLGLQLASSLRDGPFLLMIGVSQFEKQRKPQTTRPRSAYEGYPFRNACASGADPSIRKTRSRTDCVPTRGPKLWSAAGSCPLIPLWVLPQTGTPY